MLQLHRIYTPEELRAMARPAPAESRHRHAAGHRPGTGRPNRDHGRKTVLSALARLVRRGAVRRPAPGTT